MSFWDGIAGAAGSLGGAVTGLEHAIGSGLEDRSYGGGGAGGGYSLSPDQLRSFITQWKSVKEDIVLDGKQITSLAEFVRAPAPDGSSGFFTSTTKDSVTALAQHNQQMQQYVDTYIQKLEASLSSYQKTDEATAQSLPKGEA